METKREREGAMETMREREADGWVMCVWVTEERWLHKCLSVLLDLGSLQPGDVRREIILKEVSRVFLNALQGFSYLFFGAESHRCSSCLTSTKRKQMSETLASRPSEED